MKEKRRYHRLNIKLPACYQATDLQKNLSIATTLDISGLGICLLSKEKLTVGQELPIQVTLPTEEKIVINARVIWVQEVHTSNVTEYKSGLKLIEPAKGDESKFVKFYAEKFMDHFSKEKE